jgi:ubiquinone/menaquinone biosynthesis C-methylase UbiE
MPDLENVDSEQRVQWIYASRNNEELAERYDGWAKEYDQDLEETFAWVGPRRAAEVLAEHVAPTSKVLDAGAGTGLVGVELQRLGFSDLCAMDLSQGMLAEARAKDCYNDFQQMTLGERLDFPSDAYDAVISVGVFTPGHAPPHAFDELCRVTKPGGCVAFSLRPDAHVELGFKEKQEQMVETGTWSLVAVTEAFAALPKGEPDVMHQVWVYRVN